MWLVEGLGSMVWGASSASDAKGTDNEAVDAAVRFEGFEFLSRPSGKDASLCSLHVTWQRLRKCLRQLKIRLKKQQSSPSSNT